MQNTTGKPKSPEDEFMDRFVSFVEETSSRKNSIPPPFDEVLAALFPRLHGPAGPRHEASAEPYTRQKKIAKEIQTCVNLLNDLIKQGHEANLAVDIDQSSYRPYEQLEVKFSIPLKLSEK